jgi:hypothetical protein
MAGIFDEVMDGIAAKEKQTPATAAPPPAQPPAATTPVVPPAPEQQTPPPAAGEQKGLHEYSDEFKAKYGERKKPA